MINIAIWGAGNFGEFILNQIEINSEYNVKFVIDSSDNREWLEERKRVLKKAIISPEQFRSEKQDVVEFVLITFLGGTKSLLSLKGDSKVKFGSVKNIVFLRRLLLGDDLQNDTYILWEADVKNIGCKAYMNHLQCNIIDSCNLNCKGCSHFANLFSSESHYDIEQFRRDIDRIASIIYLEEIVLVGGEPFLKKDILDYISFIREKMPFASVMIVSNGILIPRLDETVLRDIASAKVRIIITEYPPTTKLKEEIMRVLKKYKINYSFTEKVDTFGKNLDLSGKNDPYYAQRHCRQYICQFLRSGKIYKCPFAALHDKFYDYFNMPGRIDTGIDIYDELDWNNTLKDLYDSPIELCRYCGEEERFQWQPQQQVNKEDWLV